MLRSGFGTDKVKGSTNVLSKRTIIDQYPSVRRAFNSFPEAYIASTTYTSNFAALSDSGGTTVASIWNNLFSDSQYLRQTNSAIYPVLNTGASLKGNGPLQFLVNDSMETLTSFPATYTGVTYIVLFEYASTTNPDQNIIQEYEKAQSGGHRAGGISVYADSTTFPKPPGAGSMRNYQSWFRNIAGQNTSQAAAFGPGVPFLDNNTIQVAIVQKSLDTSGAAGDETITFTVKDEDLNVATMTMDRTTVSPADSAAHWTGVYATSFPGAKTFLRLATGSENLSYYVVLVYNDFLEDEDLSKIVSMIKTMYGM
jgi:hypothetical protein